MRNDRIEQRLTTAAAIATAPRTAAALAVFRAPSAHASDIRMFLTAMLFAWVVGLELQATFSEGAVSREKHNAETVTRTALRVKHNSVEHLWKR